MQKGVVYCWKETEWKTEARFIQEAEEIKITLQ